MGFEPAAVHRCLEDTGVAVIPDVLEPSTVSDLLQALDLAALRQPHPTHVRALDPNAHNVRVFDLVAADRRFADLLEHPIADAVVGDLLGADYIVSNLTANVARPGSEPMFVHSDQALVAPEPWSEPWAVNVIWCLGDVHADNGATRYVPGSHLWTHSGQIPPDLGERLQPIRASKGSVVAMDGRVWHTSGANVTEDEDRPLVFAYYTRPFLRPQWNFTAALAPERQAECSPTLRYRLGLDVTANLGGLLD